MNHKTMIHATVRKLFRGRFAGLAIAIGLILPGNGTQAKDGATVTTPTAPKTAELQAFVLKSLEGMPDFHPDGLLTRGQATRAVAMLEAKGWTTDKKDDLLKRTLPDDDILVRQLNDPAGKKFLEKIGKVDGSIDRVDRLARMPQGETNINDLIRKVPNGHEWITSMLNTPHGRRMAQRLESAKGGADFNEPTGRIYTVRDFVDALDGHLVRK